MVLTNVAFCNAASSPAFTGLLFSITYGLARQVQHPGWMRIAIPKWQGRVAPVFDVAGHLLLVDVEDGRVIHRQLKRLARTEMSSRAAKLVSYHPDVLICGAISAPLQFKIIASGVRVSAFICGDVEQVLAAYLNGTLINSSFTMPGCQRGRWRSGEDVLPGAAGLEHKHGRAVRGARRASG